MKRYLERIQQVSMEDYIIIKDTYGDWCMPPESQELMPLERSRTKNCRSHSEYNHVLQSAEFDVRLCPSYR